MTETTDLLDRLRRHSGPAIMGCTCRSDLPNCPSCDCGHAANEIERLRSLLQPEAALLSRWKHVKRGTTYTEIGRAELQAARDVIEGMTFVVYRGENGKLWVRQEDEFEDGRFERVS